MVEVLRVALVVLVVASLLSIAAYVIFFSAVVARTMLSGSPRDLSTEELDQVLAEILRNGRISEVKPDRQRPAESSSEFEGS